MAKNNYKNILIRGFSWGVVNKFGATGILLLFNALIARYLSPQEMGTYFLALSIVSSAIVLTQLGLNQSIIRFISESIASNRPGRARQAIIKTYIYFSLGSAFIVTIYDIGVGDIITKFLFKSDILSQTTFIISIWFFLLSLQSLITESFRGFKKYHLCAIHGNLGYLLITTIITLAYINIYHHLNLNIIIHIIIFSIIINLLFSSTSLIKIISELKGRGTISYKEIFNSSWPLLASTFPYYIISQADIFIIGIFRSKQEVALYASSSYMAFFISGTLILINSVMPPITAELNSIGDKKGLETLLRKLVSWASIISFTLFLFYFFAGSQILSIIYGDFYKAGVNILIILGLAQLINVICGPCGITLAVTGNEKTVMKISMFTSIVNLCGALALVRAYGSNGVAFISLFSLTLQNILTLIATYKKVGIWTCIPFRFSFH